jgi:peptidoglycan/xylan/chitin deacetylase (PgdA/CDA1 family)/GT2 family glycosyltransferase
LAVSVDELRALVLAERAAGRDAATLLEYTTAPPDAARFTLSFDDAHRSVLELAAPVLAELGVTATLFVATAWLGTSDEWLDGDELRRLRDLGWVIGAHSVTHPRMSWALYDETPAQHAARLADECARSREELARALGAAPALFAYPYGEDPQSARDAARDAGFAAAFTVRETRAWDGDPWSIPRLEGMEATGLITPGDGPPLGITVVVPARDRVPILAETLSRLGEQSYPHELHEIIVVDDGSREDLRAALPADPRFHLVSSGNDTGRFRAGQTRALGAAHAHHPILAFLDADVSVGRDYLWAVDWVHRRWPRTALLGYLSGYNLHDLGHTHTLAQVQGISPLECVPVIPDRQREPTARACLDNVDWLSEPWRLCYTGNLSLPRALFDEIGGFDPHFEGWGLEDLDLGIRLHAAGARWIFSRFALGYHVVDPLEDAPRNPFRRATPTHADFAGFLANLAVLRARHSGDAAIEAYAERTLSDIDETCRRPNTVGIEFGGAASVRTRFHARLHKLQPGGVPTEELLDRVAYAVKVGAKRVWLLGGEPAEHPGFLRVLERAQAHGLHAGIHTMGYPFADLRFAREARRLNLQIASLLTIGGDAASHDALCGAGQWDRYLEGARNVEAVGIHRSAHLVFTDETSESMTAYEAVLRASGVKIDDRTSLGDV